MTRPFAPSWLMLSGLALGACTLALSSSGCVRRMQVDAAQQAEGDYFAPPPTTVLFARPLPPELIRTALVRAISERGYSAESEQPNVIIARYARGRVELRVQINYQSSQAMITYLGSVGLRIDRDGRARHYDRWMQQLSGEIQGQVAMLERRQMVAQPVQVQSQPQVVIYQTQPVPQPQPVVVQPQPVVVQPQPVVVQPQPVGQVVIQGSGAGGSVNGTIYVTP